MKDYNYENIHAIIRCLAELNELRHSDNGLHSGFAQDNLIVAIDQLHNTLKHELSMLRECD